jgi:hypothetical protein
MNGFFRIVKSELLYNTNIYFVDFIQHSLLQFNIFFCWCYPIQFYCKSRNSSVGIALGYGLDSLGSRVRLPVGAGNFSPHHSVHNGYGAHPASYSMGTRGCFPGVKRPGREAGHSPPSSAKDKEWVELYLHSPNTPTWRCAQLKHRDIHCLCG